MPLKVLIIGATGMIGQGVLSECLEHPDVASILIVGRRSCAVRHAKITELIHQDFTDFTALESAFTGCDACFWCLGVSSVRMTEAEYARVTVDYTVAAAKILARVSPDLTFCFVSGDGTDGTEKGKTMWARVKGRAENSLQRFGFKAVYCFRPAYIHPKKGVKPSYFFYKLSWLFYPIFKLLTPKYVSTTEQIGKAMLNATLHGYDRPILGSRDIVKLAGS